MASQDGRRQEGLRVHSFAPPWPPACAPAVPGPQSLPLGTMGTLDLGPGACAWPDRKLLFRVLVPPCTLSAVAVLGLLVVNLLISLPRFKNRKKNMKRPQLTASRVKLNRGLVCP